MNDMNSAFEILETAFAALPSFSRWIVWSKRNAISGLDAPGIYVLAHLTRVPRGTADPKCKPVVYIGQTCDQSLRNRLDQFAKSASTGKRAHSGGRRYHRTFHGLRPDLHVAVLPVESDKAHLRDGYILLLERLLLFRYFENWKALPICNGR